MPRALKLSPSATTKRQQIAQLVDRERSRRQQRRLRQTRGHDRRSIRIMTAANHTSNRQRRTGWSGKAYALCWFGIGDGKAFVTAGSVAIRRSVVLAGLLAIGLASPALADRAFTARFSVNANGDVAVVGNTLESCQSTVIDCANARAGLGTVLNNNNFVMARVNVDSTTVDSSSARLTLPVGAGLFADLYYGGRTNAGTGGKPLRTPRPRA